MDEINEHKKKESLLKHCDKEFYPHINAVLERIPKDVVDREILNDPTVKIVSFDPEETLGRYVPFATSVKHLIILNKSLLGEQKFQVVHTIAHELAHKITWSCKDILKERAAEELIVKWGFEKESKEVAYFRPIFEAEGHEEGYEWAKKQDDLSQYEEYYSRWVEDCLGTKDWEDLAYMVDQGDLSVAMGFVSGIMACIKERKQRSMEKDGERHEFLEQLKKIDIEMGRLFQTNQWWENSGVGLSELINAHVQINVFLRKEEEGGDES